jgi:hypothetical protein
LKPSSKPQPLPRWIAPALIALAAVFLVGLFSTEFADTDAWWHLATGRYIATHHRLPVPDPFSYTTAGAKPAYAGEEATRRFNLTHEWLAQAGLYIIYSIGGFAGLVLWKGFLLALLCLTAGHVARLRTGSTLWGVAASLAAASLAVEFAHDRPSILSFVFTALFIAIFEEDRWLWLLPPLALVWANCHGGFFLGWVVCGAYAVPALLRRRWRVLPAAGGAVLLSLANPNGIAVLGTILRYRQSAMQSSLMEWTRADLWGPPWPFIAMLYGSAVILALSWKRVRLSDWLLFAAFAAAAISAFRNEMLIGLLAPILIASYWPWKRVLRMPPPLPVVAHYAAGALLAGGILWGITSGRFFQLRAAEWRFPSGAANFLQANGIRAPLFNTYEYGGYLMWRGESVFIDGRALSESVFQEYRIVMGTPAGDPRRAQMLDRYGVGAVVMNSFEYNSGTLYPLVLDLAQPESGWTLAYEDPQALVFLRHLPPGIAALPKSRVIDHLEAECRLHVERDPEFSLCARTLANLLLKSGARTRGRAMLALYLEHPYGDDPEARQAYMDLVRQ